MSALHSSESVSHFTPRVVVEAARATMGGIDLDPASCAEANSVVQASRYYTKEDDGLKQPWHGRVFLNPPGRAPGQSKSLAGPFWDKLSAHWMRREVEQAVFVCFSLEMLQQFQKYYKRPLDFPFCVPSKRIKFWTPSGEGDSPTHANAVILLGCGPESTDRFRTAFAGIGQVVVPG